MFEGFEYTLELRDLFAFIFLWDSLTKLQFRFCCNKMHLLDIKIILNILTIVNLKCLKYLL